MPYETNIILEISLFNILDVQYFFKMLLKKIEMSDRSLQSLIVKCFSQSSIHQKTS